MKSINSDDKYKNKSSSNDINISSKQRHKNNMYIYTWY